MRLFFCLGLVLAALFGQEPGEVDEISGRINAVISEAFEKGTELFPAKLPVITKLSPAQIRCGDYIIREGASLLFQLAFDDKDGVRIFRTFVVSPRVITVRLDKKATNPRFKMTGKDQRVQAVHLTMSPKDFEEARFCLP